MADLVGSSETGRILYSDHLDARAADIYARACAMGIEGVVSKLKDSPYGPAGAWTRPP